MILGVWQLWNGWWRCTDLKIFVVCWGWGPTRMGTIFSCFCSWWLAYTSSLGFVVFDEGGGEGWGVWCQDPRKKTQRQPSPPKLQVEWACCMARGGFALGMRKSDGNLGAVVVVLPYNQGIPNDFSASFEMLTALRACGMPPSKELLTWQDFCFMFVFLVRRLHFEWAKGKSLKFGYNTHTHTRIYVYTDINTNIH